MQELKTTINGMQYRIKYRVDLCDIITIWNIYGCIGPHQKEIDLMEHVVNLLSPEKWDELETECKEHAQEQKRILEFNLQ